MTHRFNTEVAQKCGLIEAILIENLYFWTQKNQKNPPVEHMGRRWSYCSVRRFSLALPYLSERQIKDAMKRMVEAGYVYKTHLEGTPNNTNYYALSEALLHLYSGDQKQQQDLEATQPSTDTDFQPLQDESLGTKCTNHLVQNVPSEAEPVSTKCTNHLVQNVLTTWSEKYQPIYDDKKKIVKEDSNNSTGKLFELNPTKKIIVTNDFKKWTYDEFCFTVSRMEEYPTDMREAFIRYWSEKDSRGHMRFQLNKTWDTKGRLVTWASKEFNQPKTINNVGTQKNRITPTRSGKSAGASNLLDSLGEGFSAAI